MVYLTEDEMLKKEQFFAIGCIGGMSEGFDYSECRALVKYWSDQREKCHYRGGCVNVITGEEALCLQRHANKRLHGDPHRAA